MVRLVSGRAQSVKQTHKSVLTNAVPDQSRRKTSGVICDKRVAAKVKGNYVLLDKDG